MSKFFGMVALTLAVTFQPALAQPALPRCTPGVPCVDNTPAQRAWIQYSQDALDVLVRGGVEIAFPLGNHGDLIFTLPSGEKLTAYRETTKEVSITLISRDPQIVQVDALNTDGTLQRCVINISKSVFSSECTTKFRRLRDL